MTPKKAAALSKELNVRCDSEFMFACRVGSIGTHVSCKCTSDPKVMLTMFLGLLDGMFDRLEGKPEETAEFKALFSALLKDYMEDEL